MESEENHLSSGSPLDWVKPPQYRSTWNTFHSQNLLKYYLDYADRLSGPILHTLNLLILNQKYHFETGNIELNISPMCATSDERGLFLPKVYIHQLNLIKIGTKVTKKYGEVDTYSGVKMKLVGQNCGEFIYNLPDGYVFELPEIFSSARLASLHPHSGIPQRQGIVHRELFYNHAIISYHQVLYGLTYDLFHISGIPALMSKFPRCEVSLHQGPRSTLHNLNSKLRPFIYPEVPNDLSEPYETFIPPSLPVHPSLLDDEVDSSHSIEPVYIRLRTFLHCYSCHKPHKSNNSRTMIYCPLCRKRCVQSPHIYCSRQCQIAHRQAHYAYHESSQSEQHIIDPIIFTSPQDSLSLSQNHLAESKRISSEIVQFRRSEVAPKSSDENNKTELRVFSTRHLGHEDIVRHTENEFQQGLLGLPLDRVEVWIVLLVVFYLLCWSLLVDRRHFSDDEL